MKIRLTTLRQHPAATMVLTRLATLLALEAAATLVACAAAGAGSFKLFDTLVAIVAAAAAVASLPLAQRRGPRTEPATHHQRSVNRTKKILVLAMTAGAIAYVGGRGTMAIFTAETANSGGQMSSGTLVLGNKVNSGSTCYSYSGSTMDNVNTACTNLVAPTNMAPGLTSAQAKLAVENDGSLDASVFTVSAPWPKSALGTALSTLTAPSSLTLSSALNAPLVSGNKVRVSYSGHSQDFTVGPAGAAATATTIPLVAGQTPNFDYPVGSRAEDISGNTSPATTECWDQTTTNANVPVPGATPGNILPFVTTTNNPLCAAVLFWVQEQTNGVNYCWYGRGSSSSPAPSTVGQCRTPTTAAVASTLTAGSPVPGNTLTVSPALTGNIASGDTLSITEGTHTETFTAAAAAYIGDTTISINTWSPTFAYTTAAVIKDTTAFDALNGDSFDTVSNFDTTWRPNSSLTLYPLTANNTAPNAAATVSLGKYNSTGTAGYKRTFYIGVYLPAPSSTAQNQLQGLLSTFGLLWHIQQ
jgi:hypothetical protein